MCMIVGKDDRFAGDDLNRIPIRNLRCQSAFDDVVIQHEVIGPLEQRTAIFRSNLREDTPRRGEFRMQKDAALQSNNSQHI